MDEEKSDLKIIREDIKKLNENMKALTEAINNLTSACSRMDGHIDFVENTYDILRTPLNFVVRQVDRLRGIESIDLNDSIDLPRINTTFK